MPFSTAFWATALPISLAAATLPPVFTLKAIPEGRNPGFGIHNGLEGEDRRQRGNCGCRNHGFALLVVDHLRVDVVERAVDVQPRPLPGARKLGADARVNALADCVSLGLRNHGLSFLSAEPPCGPVRLNQDSGFRDQGSDAPFGFFRTPEP